MRVKILDSYMDLEMPSNINTKKGNKDSLEVNLEPLDNTPRITKAKYYLDIALSVSKRSTCLRRHYGCVIVKDDEIISTGYNGAPRNEINCCDLNKCQRPNAKQYHDYENCVAVHAEQNAMISAARKDMLGSTLYLACEEFENGKWKRIKNPVPCKMCLKMITNAGIKEIMNDEAGVIVKW